MPKLFVDANPSWLAYVLDGGGSNYTHCPAGRTSMEAEYMAIIYGLNEYFLKWQKELDARQDNIDTEKSSVNSPEFYSVASPSNRTPRPLPPPVEVCSDNEVVVKQLTREYHIGNERLRKLANRVWQMTKNVDVKFSWVSRKDNLAGMMLP